MNELTWHERKEIGRQMMLLGGIYETMSREKRMGRDIGSDTLEILKFWIQTTGELYRRKR